MEVIQSEDLQLVKFLGSGGYGEVYLGKWQNSECAIKCLNPSLFYQVSGDTNFSLRCMACPSTAG